MFKGIQGQPENDLDGIVLLQDLQVAVMIRGDGLQNGQPPAMFLIQFRFCDGQMGAGGNGVLAAKQQA